MTQEPQRRSERLVQVAIAIEQFAARLEVIRDMADMRLAEARELSSELRDIAQSLVGEEDSDG